MNLAGKTIFVSGGSRGIGLAIVKRAAADGANVAIAAKTVEPNPKLPGTIYTAAQKSRPRVAGARTRLRHSRRSAGDGGRQEDRQTSSAESIF